MIGTALLLSLGLGAVASRIGASIAGSLTALGSNLARLAEGSLDVEIGEQSRKDEVGAIARALEGFRQSLMRIGALEIEQTRFAAEAQQSHRQAMAGMSETFEAEHRRHGRQSCSGCRHRSGAHSQ